ncbi:hypothetical protein cyc_04703 [Cyclospora cayetanensis]|uniref:Uncharacterized protein n=1 Tax=Cyclospora cayetanensis TaxID=88456 RepID=A0A1D3D2U6_9EIME|nr:hypothetical protein cyc_04703 [Cyclospora cayetanensis]
MQASKTGEPSEGPSTRNALARDGILRRSARPSSSCLRGFQSLLMDPEDRRPPSALDPPPPLHHSRKAPAELLSPLEASLGDSCERKSEPRGAPERLVETIASERTRGALSGGPSGKPAGDAGGDCQTIISVGGPWGPPIAAALRGRGHDADACLGGAPEACGEATKKSSEAVLTPATEAVALTAISTASAAAAWAVASASAETEGAAMSKPRLEDGLKRPEGVL